MKLRYLRVGAPVPSMTTDGEETAASSGDAPPQPAETATKATLDPIGAAAVAF